MTVLCSEGQYDNARAQLPDLCRNGKGERRGIDWGFNAWGGEVDGLYPSWENDNRVARKFCDLDPRRRRERPAVCAFQAETGRYVGCLEELAFNQGWLTEELVHKAGQELGMTLYGQYLQCL